MVSGRHRWGGTQNHLPRATPREKVNQWLLSVHVVIISEFKLYYVIVSRIMIDYLIVVTIPGTEESR